MKKITLMLLFFITALTYGQNFVNCSQTFTASGPDSAGTQLIINASDITCNDGLAINSISVASATGSFASGFCSLTGGGWFEFFLSIDGGAEQAVCAAELNGLDLTGFSSLVITSSDTDNWTDTVTMTLNLDVEHEAPQNPAISLSTLNYGAVFNINPSSSETLAITNTGGEPLTVDLSSASEELTVTGLPLTIAPGETESATVVLNAVGLSAGAYTGTISLTSNDPNNATVEVDVTATILQAVVSSGMLFEDFETTAAFQLPAGWTGNFSVRDNGGIDNSKRLTRNLWGTGAAQTGQFTTSFVEMGDEPEMSFFYRAVNWSGYPSTPTPATSFAFTVFVSTDFGANFVPIWVYDPDAHNVSTNYAEVTIDVSDYANQTVLFAVAASTIGGDLFLDFDNFNIGTPPDCLTPQNLEVTNITTNSVELSWDAVDNATNYTWFVFEAGDNPEVDTPVATGTTATTSALVEGLEDASSYQAYVKTNCDLDGESELSSAVVFATSCNSVDVFPYEYGFEGDGSLDVCWQANNLAGTGNWTVATVSADGFQPNSGEYLAYLIWSGGLKTAELISAPLNLSVIGGSVEMSIFLHRHSFASAINDFYKIHINDTPSLSGATELLQIFSRNDIEPTVPSNGFYEYTMSIPESFESSTEAYIIIEGSASGWDIAVDDFSIYAAPEPTFANVQIIHNSPDPAASSVDVYVNGDLLPELSGLDFRNATAFLEVPAETDLEIDVVPAGGELSASVHNQTFNLDPDENYVVVANGLLADFELTVFSGARLAADDASDVDVLVHHGSPDAPAVDVAIDGVGVVVPNISFPEFQGYLSVSPVDVELQILPAGGDTPVAVYAAPLSGLEGAAVTVVASGLFGDGAEESNSFGLWVATATGGALIELPLVEEDDAPMEPAPTPTEDENLVISLFSNAYDDVPVNTWLTPWSSAQLEDIQIQGVDTKLYTNLDFAGVEMTGDNSIDATSMLKFHVDFWTPNMTTVRVKLVDFGPDNAFGGGDDTEHELVFEDLVIGEWNSLELDLEDFVNLTNTANISQLIFSGLVDGVPGVGTLYVDNVYFSTVSLSNTDFDATNFTYYPNPVKNQLTIQSANTVEKVEVYNMLGQKVIFAKPNSKTPSVQMGDLTSGVYLMKVSINGAEKSFQVIKQ